VTQGRIVEKVALHQHRLGAVLRGFAGSQGEVTQKMLQQSLSIVGVPLGKQDVKRLLASIDPDGVHRKTADTLVAALDKNSLAVAENPDVHHHGIDRPCIYRKGSHAHVRDHLITSRQRPAGITVQENDRIRGGSQIADVVSSAATNGRASNVESTPKNPSFSSSMEEKVRQMVEDSVVAKFRDHHMNDTLQSSRQSGGGALRASADLPASNRKRRALELSTGTRHNSSIRVGLELGHVLQADGGVNQILGKSGTSVGLYGSQGGRVEDEGDQDGVYGLGRDDLGMWSAYLTEETKRERGVHNTGSMHTGKAEPAWKHDVHMNENGHRVASNLQWSERREAYGKQQRGDMLHSGKKLKSKIHQATAGAAGVKTKDYHRIHKQKKRLDAPVIKNQRSSEQVAGVIQHHVLHQQRQQHQMEVRIGSPKIRGRTSPANRASPVRVLHMKATPPPPHSTGSG
jgi:hypothetical protein